MLFLLIPFLVGIDLLSKYYASIFLQEKYSVFWDIFFLRYIENIGIAFSVPITWFPLKILTIVILSYLVFYYITQEKSKKNTLIDLSFIFIFSWWMWNAYERIFHERVIDFIGIQYFAIFNLADVFITFWVILYISSYFFQKKINS